MEGGKIPNIFHTSILNTCQQFTHTPYLKTFHMTQSNNPYSTQWNEHTMTETGWYTSHTYICYKWNVPTVHVKHTQINDESIAWWVPALIFAPNIYINMYRCEQISAQVHCFIFGRGSFTIIHFFPFFLFFFFFSQNNHKLLLDMSIPVQGYHFAVKKKEKEKKKGVGASGGPGG